MEFQTHSLTSLRCFPYPCRFKNDWAPPVHDNEDGGAKDWPLPDGPESWDGPRGSDSNVGDVSEDDLLS